MTKARDLSVGIPNGLVLIKPTGATNGTVNDSGTVTIGSAVSSVTVAGAFSATYDAYKIILLGGTGTNNKSIAMQIGAATTGYYWTMPHESYSGGGGVVRRNNVTNFNYIGNSQTAQLSVTCEVLNPFQSTNTLINAFFVDPAISGVTVGFLNNSTSYTAFTLISEAASTFTGGTIRVYGYRK